MKRDPTPAARAAGSGDAAARVREILMARCNDATLVKHLEILFGDVRIGGRDALELYAEALDRSRTGITREKWYRRAQRAFSLAKYFEHSLGISGARAECGVALGFSALLLCRVAERHQPAFDGAGFFVFDSFEGLSEIREQDLAGAGGPAFRQGDMAYPLEHVRHVLADYPAVSLNKGWIPDVFSRIAEQRWAFVHIDVDLYEPTLASLEYFHPRMSPGGVIVNDDYASPSFPGGGRAWDDYCRRNDVRFFTLDTGQAVILA